MVTLKDVASAAQVSATTVSLIINGKSDERRISPETKARVLEIMAELGYQPNLSARRLRSKDYKKPIIAFYWPSDYRSNILASFLASFQDVIHELNFDCELIVQTFKNGELEKSALPIIHNSYHGVIIGATSKEDDEFLETLSPRIPIVLLNRKSEKHSTVSIDHNEVGLKAAKLFYEKGYRETAIFTSPRPYVATGLRTQAFMYSCAQIGINVKTEHIFYSENTIEGGVQAAEEYCKMVHPPKAVFCDSDSMALGALYSFHKHHLTFPTDVELLAVGYLESESTAYSVPAVSVVAMPNRDVIKNAVLVIMQKLTSADNTPVHQLLDSKITLRETFQL